VQLSYRQIAEEASLSLQTAFKAVKALKEAGVLEGA
jgi:DNA-binding Lrp family transcriptional regulator